MKYKKLGILKFGGLLVETGDLDPIYMALWNVKIHPKRLKRLLFAYWCFYHLGVAAKLSQYKGKKFYDVMEKLVRTTTPRGTERRHFRGKAALEAIAFFRDMNGHFAPEVKKPEVWVNELSQYENVNDIINHLDAHWPQFGPWIAFKAADMVERLGLKRIKFPVETLKMYRDPKLGAQMVCKAKGWDWDTLRVPGVVDALLVKGLEHYLAPPRNERMLNAQEIETILCKWKSHMKGHYPIGKDTKEIIHHCKGWGKLAGKYRRYLIGLNRENSTSRKDS